MSKCVGTFLAYGSFCIEVKNLFVIYGDVEMDNNCELNNGMEVLVHCYRRLSISREIHAIEFVRKPDREYIGICINYDDSEERDILVALNVGDEICEIHDS